MCMSNILIAPFLSKKPTTSEIEYFGGILKPYGYGPAGYSSPASLSFSTQTIAAVSLPATPITYLLIFETGTSLTRFILQSHFQ